MQQIETKQLLTGDRIPPFRLQAMRQVLDFGKHRGRHIDQVDDCYLEWILKNFSECDPWCKEAGEALTSRGKTNRVRAKTSVRDLLSDLKICTRKRDLQEGRRLHTSAMESGNDPNMFVAVALIRMYAKCGSMLDSRQVFDKIDKLDVVSWTAVIMGYADNGQGRLALDLFSRMKAERVCVPDSVTYVAAIKACASLAAPGGEAGKRESLVMGREIHSEIGHRMDTFVQSALIDMYAKCGSMEEAQRVFDMIEKPGVVSWTIMIMGYAETGQGQAALNLFSRMTSACWCMPDSVTYLAAIKSCASLAAAADEGSKAELLTRGREIHSMVGHETSRSVQNTLIDMYAKCGSVVEAQQVFDRIQDPGLVAWNALIMGYAANGQGEAALDMFLRMKTAPRCSPDAMTYVAALKACASIGALAVGRKFHAEITDFDAHLVTCLVDLYSKCGSMVEAREVFHCHPRKRNITTWNALLAGYASFGDSEAAFELFEAMRDERLRPNAVTFVCMLLCCSHGGLVERAREYLEAMPVQYEVAPRLMHYTCMVDVLGRANQLNKALALLQRMPCSPDAVIWRALLGACRKWKNVGIGRLAFESCVDLNEKIASAYVPMAQIYGSVGLWEDQERVLEMGRVLGAWKQQGQAYVMDGLGRMVSFVVGEEDPPEVEARLKQFLESVKDHSCT